MWWVPARWMSCTSGYSLPGSRHETAPVAREERRLAEVADAERLRDETRQADREAAVRRHPVAERVEEAAKRRRVEAALAQSGEVIVVPVQALATADDLDAAVQQVEARRPGLLRAGMRVERALRRREPLDEYELAVLGADAPFVLRRQVGLLAGADRSEVDDGDRTGGRLPDRVQHREHAALDDRHHVAVVADEPELGVERHELRQVAPRLVRLGAERRPTS